MAPQREWFEKDYYKVLGVAENADHKEIAKAYRKLAKQYHPDANPGSEDRFKEVSAAYEVLGDEAKRKEYDEVRRLGAAGNPFANMGGGAGRPGGGFSGNFKVDDLGDLLGNIFGRSRSGAGRAGGAAGTRTGAAAGAQRGADLETTLHLSFLDAVHGLTTTVNVTSEVTCHTCHGNGAAPGTAPTVCPVCGGRGVVQDNQGLFSFSQPCQVCSGTGFRVENPCPTCQGTGVEYAARQVKVRIPAGVEDGQRIRVKGRGGAGRGGGPAGNLYVLVHVEPHKFFGRKGRDLTLSVPITFAEAALGTTVTVPTLAKPVTLKVPAGSRSGRTFRVRGRGVPASSGAGDLLVTVEVAVPERLTPEEHEAVAAVGELISGDALRAGLWGEA
ncbi:MAG TPA: molecular chaperone DnaJ [Acidimicrobiales bacterium]|nr:molecular chaperone DnaJ [Acidimicrobiales bacterium]